MLRSLGFLCLAWVLHAAQQAPPMTETEFIPSHGQEEPGDSGVVMEPTEFSTPSEAESMMGKDEELQAQDERVKKEQLRLQAEELYKKTEEVRMKLEAERNEKMQMTLRAQQQKKALELQAKKEAEARQAVIVATEAKEEARRRQLAATLMDRDEDIQVQSRKTAEELIAKEQEAFQKRRAMHDEVLWREHAEILDQELKQIKLEKQRNITRIQNEQVHRIEVQQEEERSRLAKLEAKEALRKVDFESGERDGDKSITQDSMPPPAKDMGAGVMFLNQMPPPAQEGAGVMS